MMSVIKESQKTEVASKRENISSNENIKIREKENETSI